MAKMLPAATLPMLACHAAARDPGACVLASKYSLTRSHNTTGGEHTGDGPSSAEANQGRNGDGENTHEDAEANEFVGLDPLPEVACGGNGVGDDVDESVLCCDAGFAEEPEEDCGFGYWRRRVG